jgi:hypothetical protein
MTSILIDLEGNMTDIVAEPQAAKPAPEAKEKGAYSSVVYFHGMGSQRRYEETSRVIDSLDRYMATKRDSNESLGYLRDIGAKVELLRPATPTNDTVAYIHTRFMMDAKGKQAHEVRFYEAYWAPVMAERKSAWAIVKWIFRQPLRPWITLRTPWRERQRLRRASLVALFEHDRANGKRIAEKHYVDLLRFYNDFEGLDAQRRFADGTFDEFLSFVAQQCKDDATRLQGCETLARAWFHAYRLSELRNAACLAVMAFTLALAAAAVVLGILLGLQSALAFAPLAELLGKFGEPPKADWRGAAAVGVVLLSLFGITRFLTEYLGDVEAWATYEETDLKHVARNKVLDQSLQILTHVLSDPKCKRVTIVAHSLGTSIAHDTLLALLRRNMAHRPNPDPIAQPVPLVKIEHFVTMGSPIDKIEYFFESYSSASHRYKRVVESLRGDIGTPPFSRNNKPFVHWINFWDRGDVISGALHSPASAVNVRHRVDNVHVASFWFPVPGASHAGYFTHRTVIDTLFNVIYRRAWSFRTLTQPATNQSYDYDSVYLGPGEPAGIQSICITVALLLPLLALLALADWLFGMPLAWYVGAGGASAAAIFLLGTYLISRVVGQRNRI